MSRSTLLSICFPALSLLAACSGAPSGPGPGPGPGDPNLVQSEKQRVTTPSVSQAQMASATASARGFGLELYKQLVVGKKNVFFSPHSISSALLMTYAGAAGTTASEIRDVLQLSLPDAEVHAAANAVDLALESRGQGQSGQDSQPFRLRVANAIWGQKGYSFLAGFLDTLAINYGAGMNVVDFTADPESARVTINGWVEDKTEDKIKELLPAGVITQGTRLVLTNAVYFNAAWADPFEAAQTANAPFHTLDGTTVTTPTMKHGLLEASYYEESPLADAPALQAVALPYAGNELSMVVIVPGDLASFEAGLSLARLDQILGGLASRPVDLSLPKWKVNDEAKLKEPLSALGMPAAFTEGVADFSGIDGAKNLMVSDVVHKAFVSVDEKGTEAAAATGVIIGPTSVPEFVTMKVDRPFVYLIRDNATGAIVFMGRVVDPTL